MGLLNFSNIEGVLNMDCCGGVTRAELDETRDEPPHKIKGCIPHQKYRGGLEGYRWEWESPCTGQASPNCCGSGATCIPNSNGGYCRTDDGDEFKYCPGEVNPVTNDISDGSEPIPYRQGLKCNQSEKEALTLFCPGIELDNLKNECIPTRSGFGKCLTIDKMYKNIMILKNEDFDENISINRKLNKIKEYHKENYKSTIVDKNDSSYGKIPLSQDCKTSDNEVCYKGKYYYDNVCNYSPKSLDQNIYNLEYIYIILIIIVIFIFYILVYINKNKGGSDGPTASINKSKGIGGLEKSLFNF